MKNSPRIRTPESCTTGATGDLDRTLESCTTGAVGVLDDPIPVLYSTSVIKQHFLRPRPLGVPPPETSNTRNEQKNERGASHV